MAAALAAGTLESARGYSANDTLNVACIGTGGRCQRLMTRLVQIPGVRITAVCDVWDVHLQAGRKLADPQAVAETDYRRLLERRDVDAVLIGTPDHWHVPMTIDACDAGKHVYVEKPLTHDLGEGPRVLAAAQRSKAIVQVGTQQRSMPHLQEARQLVRNGALGTVHKIRMTWNRNQQRWQRDRLGIDPTSVRWKQFLGNAPDQPFDEYRFRHWRWFWDFGGGIFTDLMVHWMDTAYWMLDLGDPSTVCSIGDQFAAAGLWETPDTVQTLVQFPQANVQVHFEGTFVNHRQRAMMELMGTKATLYLDRGRYEIHPERGSGVPYRERIDSAGERGADFFDEVDGELYHLRNWVECIRSNTTPASTVADGVRAAAVAHLANQSYRSGKTVRAPVPDKSAPRP
jgi:predicted dehydrogenase